MQPAEDKMSAEAEAFVERVFQWDEIAGDLPQGAVVTVAPGATASAAQTGPAGEPVAPTMAPTPQGDVASAGSPPANEASVGGAHQPITTGSHPGIKLTKAEKLCRDLGITKEYKQEVDQKWVPFGNLGIKIFATDGGPGHRIYLAHPRGECLMQRYTSTTYGWDDQWPFTTTKNKECAVFRGKEHVLDNVEKIRISGTHITLSVRDKLGLHWYDARTEDED